MNLIVKVNSKDNLNEYINRASKIILPTKFSLRCENHFTWDEIYSLTTLNPNQIFFVEVDKIIHEFEVEKTLLFVKKVSQLVNVGIIYQDQAILNFVLDNNLNIELTYDPLTYVTSSKQINFYQNFGVKNVVLSRELTIQEIKKIFLNANEHNNIWMQGFGYTQMLHSKRALVDNYLDFEFKTYKNKLILNKENLSLYDQERDLSYPLICKTSETFIMSALSLSVMEEILKLNKYGVNNLILDFTLQTKNTEKEIFEIYNNAITLLNTKQLTKEKVINLKQEIDIVTNNKTNLGLLYKKTMYKI